MANEETGFFRFGTNADGVAADIEGAMARINRSLASQGKGISSANINTRDTEVLKSNLKNTEAEVKASVGRVRSLMEQVSTGTITPGKFGEEFRKEVRGTLGSLPASMATDMGGMGKSTALRLPMQQIGKDMGGSIVQTLLSTVRDSMPELVKGLGPSHFKPAIQQLGMHPVAFGQEQTRLAELQNMKRLDELAQKYYLSGKSAQFLEHKVPPHMQQGVLDMTQQAEFAGRARLGPQGGMYYDKGPFQQEISEIKRLDQGTDALARRSKEMENYNRVSAAEKQGTARGVGAGKYVLTGEEGGKEVYRRTGEGTMARLQGELEIREALAKELQLTDRLTEADKRRSKIKADDAARTAKQESEAQRAAALAQGDLTRRGGRIVSPGGAVDRVTPGGATPETNPIRIADARRAEYDAQKKAQDAQEAADEKKARADKTALEEKQKLAREQATYSRLEQEYANKNAMSVGRGTYVVGQRGTPDNEVIRQLGAGRAESVQDNLAVERSLVAQEKALAAIAAQEARVNAQEERRAARSEAQQAGVVGGFQNRFQRGGETFGTAIGESVASAARFTIAYGALFAMIGALKDIGTEFLDYQDSLTDLEVATNHTGVATQSYVNDLSDLARVSGANVGQSLDTAARGIRAFGSELSGTKEEIKDGMREIGEATNAAATKLSLISGKSLGDATGDLVAAGTAFGLRPDQLDQITDAVANAKRNVGGDAGQISQGLALIANAAQEAGFNLNEAAAVIGLVQARTDESGQAIATRLTRIFQIISGSTGKSLAREFQSFGVDANASVKDQLESYAKIYADPNASQATRSRITSGLGGTSNLRELLPLLKDNETLQKAYKKAIDQAGQGTSEFDRKTNNLVGTLKKLQGDLKAIEVGLALSGIFDPFAAMLQTAEPLLHLVDRLLQTWNQMPHAIRATLGVMLDLVVAAKLYSVIAARGAAAKGVEGAAALGAPAAASAGKVAAANIAAAQAAVVASTIEVSAARANEARGILGATEMRIAAETRLNTAIAGLGVARAEAEAVGMRSKVLGGIAGSGTGRFAGTRAGLAGILGFATNPATLAVGGAIAGAYGINKALDSREQIRGYEKAFSGKQNAFGTYDGTAKSLKDAAFDLKSGAANIKKSQTSSLFGLDLNKGTRDLYASKMEGQAKAVGKIAENVSAEQKRLAAKSDASVFGGPVAGVEQLGEGLDNLTNAGASATEQFNLLAKALTDKAGPAARQVYQPESFAAAFALDPNKVLKDSLGKTVQYDQTRTQYSTYGGSTTSTDTRTQSAAEFLAAHSLSGPQIGDLNEAVQKFMAKRGVKPGEAYTDADVKATSDYVADYLYQNLGIDSFSGKSKDLQDEIGKKLFAQVQTQLTGKDANSLLSGTGPLANSDLITLLMGNKETGGKFGGLFASLDASLAEIPQGDDGTMREGALRNKLQTVQTLISRARRSGEDTPSAILVKVQGYEQQLAQATVTRLERLRKVAAGSTGTTAAQAAARDAALVRKEIAAAIKGGDANLLAQIIASAGQGAVQIARATIRKALAAAKAARQADAAIAAAAAAAQSAYESFIQGGSDQQAPPSIPDSKPSAEEKRLRGLLKGLNGVTAKDSAQDIRAAQAQLSAAQAGGGGLATAAAAVTAAEAELHQATPKTVAWYNAQANLTKAQDDYQDQLRAVRPAALQAQASRLGGGLAPARAQIASARAALASEERGTTEWYQALGTLYEAQRSYSSALVSYRNNLDQLHGDITDPVENARDALRAAQRQLRSDRGAGKDVRAEDRLAVRQSQTQLEAAKFSQRLSDVQTAEQLGKISHSKYIAYLQNEHDRLSSIKHKSRQQIDELNEIDMAMKEAKNALDGQFNLGDINTNGLVYQIRRQAAEARSITANRSGGGAGSTQNVQISINGADVAKVKSILQTYLKVPTAQRRTLTGRRV